MIKDFNAYTLVEQGLQCNSVDVPQRLVDDDLSRHSVYTRLVCWFASPSDATNSSAADGCQFVVGPLSRMNIVVVEDRVEAPAPATKY